jgi:hypothetical protein
MKLVEANGERVWILTRDRKDFDNSLLRASTDFIGDYRMKVKKVIRRD